jgi:PEP-CTERM motif-containing protein
MLKRVSIVAAAFLSIATYAKADVLVGTPGPGDVQDCIPFGCGITNQFIFDSSYFSGPISINELTFFNSVVDTPTDNFDPGTYTFKLSTSTNDYLTPSATFANNVGANVQLFATVVIAGGAIPPVFSFAGTPFNYNPASGDLLLEVDKTGAASTFSGFTDYNGPADPNFKVSRVWNTDGSATGNVDTNYGPVARFGSGAAAVPEPMTLTLTGLGLAGFAARRLKKGRKQSS